jgi:hypothetical protein
MRPIGIEFCFSLCQLAISVVLRKISMPADDLRRQTKVIPSGRRPLFTKIAIFVLTLFFAFFIIIVNEVIGLPDQAYWSLKVVLAVLVTIAVVMVLLITRDLMRPQGTRKSTHGG